MSYFIAQHYIAFGLSLLYLLIAAVTTMPEKGIKWTWETVYGWFYDWIHLVINAAVKKYPGLAEIPNIGTVTTTIDTLAVPATSQTVVANANPTHPGQ